MTVTADLVGRDAELGQLRSLLAEAAGGGQRVALVCGEPGIGKTALLEALAAEATDAGFEAVWGRCWEGGSTAPYWPWRQVVSGCLGATGSELFADLERWGTEIDRSRLFDEVTQRILAGAGTGAGLLILLEDLHAADEGSLHLLRFLVRAAAPVPLLVVGTYRVTEVARAPAHQTAIGAVGRHGPTIRLRGLDPEQVEMLLERTGSAADRDAAHDVHRITDGNPFLVYEAARLLGDHPGATLPAEAGAVVRARLQPLGPDLRRLLVSAAVVGREFSLAVLSRLLDRPPDDLLDPLAEARELFVLDEVALGRWSFSHALLRDAMLEDLDDSGRQALHRRVATALQAVHGGDPRSMPEIAHHLAEGGDPEAPEACARAGEAAMAAGAFEDAARWFARALERLPDGLARRRYDLLLDLGAALLAAGKDGDARDAHHRAIRTARAMGSTELAAEAAVRVARIARSDAAVIRALDDALCELPEEDSALRARVLVSFASVLQGSSVDRVVLRQVSRQGRDMARRIGDRDTLWRALSQWHEDVLGDTAILDERFEVARELLEAAESSGDPEHVLLAGQAHAEVLFESGRVAEARAAAQRCLQMAAARRRPRSTLSALELLFGIALVEGRHDEAEVVSREASAVSRQCVGVDGETSGHKALIALRSQQGRFEEVERLGREAMERWTVAGLDCARQIPRVRALAELGRVAEAQALLETLVGDSPVEMTMGMLVPDIGWVAAPRLCCPTALAEACCLLEDRARAASLYESLLPRAELHVAAPPQSGGVVARYLGLVATLLRRYDEAEAHFRLAHRLHDALGLPAWAAHGRLDHGRMLLGRDGPGDRQRAAELLAEARDRFEAMGMAFYRQRAVDHLEQARRTSSAGSLRQDDGHWAFSYEGRHARLRDGMGVRLLVRLLREPGREFHALELAGGTDTERARQSVTRALKATVDRLEQAHPALGAHLRAALRIGTVSGYVPDPRAPTTWEA